VVSNRRRIKLLIAAHSGSRGGAEYCLDTLLEHLDRERFEAQVLFAWDGPMAHEARRRGYPVEIWPWAWWMGYEPSGWHVRNALLGSLGRAGRLVRRLRQEGIDVVYTNTAVLFEPALAARWAGVAHVWHVHEILGPHSMRPHLLPWRWMVRWIGRWSERVIFESHTARQCCQGLIPQEKMRVVYNSVRWDPDSLGEGERNTSPPVGEPGSSQAKPGEGEKDSPLTQPAAQATLSHGGEREKDASALVGEPGGAKRSRVRGSKEDEGLLSSPPHPNPLPPGEREGSSPHPASLNSWPPSPAVIRGEIDLWPGRPERPGRVCRFVWIGRLSQRKDPLCFLQAAAQMHQSQRCQFLLAGEGPLESQVRQTIGRLGLADRCQLLPFQEDIRPILQEADVLVLTSQEESFGLVLVEAGAFGLPVIATRTQGPTEIVLDGQTGLLVPVADPAALATAMDRLAADPAQRRRMGQAGAERVRQLFHPVQNTRQIEQILLEAAEKKQRTL